MKFCLKLTCFSILFMFFLVSGQVICQLRDAHANNRTLDLAALSIEELMEIEITSVSKKQQTLSLAYKLDNCS